MARTKVSSADTSSLASSAAGSSSSRRRLGGSACDSCKVAGLRCDSRTPCTSCVEMGKAPQCRFETLLGAITTNEDPFSQPQHRSEDESGADNEEAAVEGEEVSNNSSDQKAEYLSIWSCICWHIYATVFFFIIGSTGFAITWTVISGNMSGAFTVAGWLMTVGTLIVGVLIAKHNELCTAQS